jgi:hypothetical protein
VAEDRERRAGVGWQGILLRVVVGLCVGVPLLACLAAGGFVFFLERDLPPASAHPSVKELLSGEEARVRAELEWAARAAMVYMRAEVAAGRAVAQRGQGGSVSLGNGRMCAYNVHKEALRSLERLFAQAVGRLEQVELQNADGSAFTAQGSAHSHTWRLVARLGRKRLRFDFEWHDVAMGSSVNLESVKVLDPPAKTSPTPKKTR